MRRARLVLAIYISLSLVFLGTGVVLAAPEPVRNSAREKRVENAGETKGQYAPDEMIVKFRGGLGQDAKSRAMSGGLTQETLQKIGSGAAGDIELVRLRPGVTVEDAVKRFSGDPGVEYAEPNYVVSADYTPDDPKFSNQWGLNNTGQNIKGSAGKKDADIDAPEAWNVEKGTSNGVTVAVIDSGIDFNHPEFQGKLTSKRYNWTGIRQASYNSSLSLGTSTWETQIAQSIKGTGGKLSKVGIRLSKVGYPSGASGSPSAAAVPPAQP